MEGKFGISKTDGKTVLSTRVHYQGESSLCWDYATTSSLRKSLKVKIGMEEIKHFGSINSGSLNF